MSMQVTARNGMGGVSYNGSTYTTTGMKEDDHMAVYNDYIASAGVMNRNTDFLVTQRGAGANMSVDVSVGTALVQNASWAANSNLNTKYWRVVNDATINAVVTANASGNPRIDIVCILIDTSATPDGDASNVASIVVTAGTPAASPSAPATPSNSYKLAEIAVANGASSITTTNLTDKRVAATFDPRQTYYGIARQAFVDGGAQISQLATSVSLTSSYKYGYNDLFVMKGAGSAVSAGASATNTPSIVTSTSSYCDSITGVTLTGSGIVYGKRGVESKNAVAYKNKTASFSVVVGHNVGSTIGYVLNVYKANSADNFSARTLVSASASQNVATGTSTTLYFENVSMGDVSNGFELEVVATTGAITTKNFEFCDWQCNLGSYVLPFQVDDIDTNLQKVCRYIAVLGSGLLGKFVNATAPSRFQGSSIYPQEMRGVPAFSLTTQIVSFNEFYVAARNSTSTSMAIGSPTTKGFDISIDINVNNTLGFAACRTDCLLVDARMTI